VSDSRKIKSVSLGITNLIFKRAMLNCGVVGTDRESRYRNKEKIGKEYIRLVRNLPSPSLELIIQEHLGNIMTREEHTIQEILSELANRILIEGENETHIESANQ